VTREQREQRAESREQRAEHREQSTESREQSAERRAQRAESREQRAESSEQRAESWGAPQLPRHCAYAVAAKTKARARRIYNSASGAVSIMLWGVSEGSQK
jgi:hypothetical protein